MFLRAALQISGCSLIHSVTLQGGWIANKKYEPGNFQVHFENLWWSEYDPANQNGPSGFSQEKNRKLS